MSAFTRSDQFDILKIDEPQRLVYGWISVIEVDGTTVIDQQGDVIEEPELVGSAHEFMTNSRAGKLLHRGEEIGAFVESLVFTRDLQVALGIDLKKVGWFGVMRVASDDVWKGVMDGTYRSFSIGGSARREEIEIA